jgi:adenylate cyclase
MRALRGRRRRLPLSVVGLGTVCLFLGLWCLSPGIVRDSMRERAFDLLLPMLPMPGTDPGVVIVDIDRASLTRFGPWPWPRARLAQVVTAVAAAKPRVVGIDILLAGRDRFSGTGGSDGDAMLRQALVSAPVVLGTALEDGAAGDDLPVTPILGQAPAQLPNIWRSDGVVGPSQALADAAQGMGASVEAADADGPIRRVPLLVLTGEMLGPGLAVEVVRVAQGAGELLIEPDGLHIGDVRAPLAPDAMLRLILHRPAIWTARTVSALRLIDDPHAGAVLSGKIVLLGGSAPELGGLRVTPASPVTPSVLIQATAVDALLRGAVAYRPVWLHGAEIAFAAVLGLLCVLVAMWLRPAPAAVLSLLLCVGWVGAAVAAVPSTLWLVDPAGPAAVGFASFGAAALVRYVRDEWRARLLRERFEQHLAPEVVRRIAADPAALRLQGEMREITALFSDIEGFTSMTERAEPVDLVALLDAYFDAAARIVTEHGGMIDKIVGDSVHAIFNAPFTLDRHPERAVACALALLKASEEIRASPLGQRLQLGRTRIGIETGPAIVGDVGGSRKLDYTAHGNAINRAARLEAANKELASSICIGPGTAARLRSGSVRPIGTVAVRGQSEPVDVFTPVEEATSPNRGRS